jgi:hypothetical protein
MRPQILARTAVVLTAAAILCAPAAAQFRDDFEGPSPSGTSPVRSISPA